MKPVPTYSEGGGIMGQSFFPSCARLCGNYGSCEKMQSKVNKMGVFDIHSKMETCNFWPEMLDQNAQRQPKVAQKSSKNSPVDPT